MTDHTCIRNPDTGACYVCRVPMRRNFAVADASPLDDSLDATQHPQPRRAAPQYLCACGAALKPSETQCVDCWIAEQTKQPTSKPVVKLTKHERQH